MPYIKREDREIAKDYPQAIGELNYAITLSIIKVLNDNDISYAVLNDITDDLEKIRDWVRGIGQQKDIDFTNKGMCSNIISLITAYRALGSDRNNQMSGLMSLVISEFKRRVANRYEDKKITENGDVYPSEYITVNNSIPINSTYTVDWIKQWLSEILGWEIDEKKQ